MIPKFVYDSIPEFVYDSSSSSYVNVWNNFGMGGEYTLVNDTTLEFIPSELKTGQTYVAIVHNVFVFYPDSSVHQLPDSVITSFMTVLPPHTVLSNTLLENNGYMVIGDTIKVFYSRRLDSANTVVGPLVAFYQHSATEINALTLHYDGPVKKVRAVFRRPFKLMAITLSQDEEYTGTFAEKTYSTDRTGVVTSSSVNKRYIGTKKEVGFSEGDVIVKFHFSQPVNPATLPMAMWCTQNWERIDGALKNSSYRAYSDGVPIPNVTLSDDDKTVEWKLTSGHNGPGNRMTKLQQFVMSTSPALRSSSNNFLTNPGDYTAQSINPDVEWYVEKVDVHHGNDFCFLCESGAEIYMPYLCVYTKGDVGEDCLVETTETSSDGSVCVKKGKIDYYNTTLSGEWSYDALIMRKNRVHDKGKLTSSVTVMDKDANVWAAVVLVLGFWADIFLSYRLYDAAILTASQAKVAFLLIYLMILGLHQAGIFDGKDDNFGTNAWVGTRENMWGIHPSYKNELTKKFNGDDGDVDVVMKVIGR